MLIFGEFNTFQKPDARLILKKAWNALQPEGLFLLEAHPLAAVQAIGESGSSWYSADVGLFSARPHLYLEENHWDAERKASTTRYYILNAASGEVERYASSMQAYSEAEFSELITASGFEPPQLFPSLLGRVDPNHNDLFVLVCKKSVS